MKRDSFKSHYPVSKVRIFLCSILATAAMTTNGYSLENYKFESQEEAFLVRRIAEFWKDKDYVLVKNQIDHFLKEHPYASINDQLRGILADLYLQENDYDKALEVYENINDPSVVEKTLINKLQCYYEKDRYSDIVKSGAQFLDSTAVEIVDRIDELHFLLAEGYFRQAKAEEQLALKKDFATQARPLYEKILDSSFREHSQFALAEIYTIINEHKLAANLYLDLANHHEDKKQDLLYHAATATAQFDAKEAIHIFTKVMDLDKSRKEEASFNRLVLYFQENDFQSVLTNYESLQLGLSDEKKPTFDYIVGRSHFAEENYDQGVEHLKKYLTHNQLESPHFKNALLMLLTSAQKLQNDELFDESIAVFKEHFQDAQELKQALFIHAMMLKAKGEFALAQKELQQIITHHPDFADQENLALEYGLVTHETKEWKTSYETLKNYLNIYAEGQQRDIAWKYFLSSALNYLKTTDENSYEYTKFTFYEDLKATLAAHDSSSEIFNSQEEKECRMLFAKTAFELDKHHEALQTLLQYVEDHPNDSTLGEAHFLTGLCHQKLGADPQEFYTHTEKAISLNPELNELSSIHLQLYNSYITKAQMLEKQDAEKNVMFSKAAEHLYKAISLGDSEIKMQNRLWLANHYYISVEDGEQAIESEVFTRALSLFETALFQPETGALISIENENLYLESEVLKYANLLGRQNNHSKQLGILKDLVSQQHEKSSYDWKLRKHALVELAKTYEAVGQTEDALETYAFITQAFKNDPSYNVDYAQLHASRLHFAKMQKSKQLGHNEEMITILNTLKELQIKKSPQSEPLHLEAALDYALVRANLATPVDKEDRYIFFLNRIKEDFTSEEDAMAREYQNQLAEQTDKQQLFELHMKFVNAEILRCEAKLEHKRNKLSNAEELSSQALSTLSEIKNSALATPYLKERVRVSIHEIDNMNTY